MGILVNELQGAGKVSEARGAGAWVSLSIKYMGKHGRKLKQSFALAQVSVVKAVWLPHMTQLSVAGQGGVVAAHDTTQCGWSRWYGCRT